MVPRRRRWECVGGRAGGGAGGERVGGVSGWWEVTG